jgi:hypothetical protein
LAFCGGLLLVICGDKRGKAGEQQYKKAGVKVRQIFLCFCKNSLRFGFDNLMSFSGVDAG